MNLSLTIVGKAFAQEGGGHGESAEQEHSGAGAATDSGQGDVTHTETGAAHGGEGDHDETFPPFDPSTFASQILWLAITFGIFYMLMARLVIPRIGGILETRSDRISQDLDEAQRLKEESEAAYAAYEHELAEARNRAHKIGQEARDKAKAEADAERERVEAELAKKLEKSEKQIASIKSEAMKEVDSIAQSTTEAIIRQLLGTATTKAELSRAIDEAEKGGAS